MVVNKHLLAINGKLKPNRGLAFLQPLSYYDQLIQEPWLADMVKRIREGEEVLKDQLPFRCAHYHHFLEGDHRTAGTCDPEAFTWQTCVDIDDKSVVEQAISRAYELNKEDGLWKDALLHMGYSARKKVHMDIRLPLGMTIEEAQQAYCKALGVKYDESCITPERFIYITDADSELYRSEHWYEVLDDEEVKVRREAYLKRGLTIDGRKNEVVKTQPEESSAQPSTTLNPELTFKGIPYTDIIREWWNRNDGEPAEGERNVKLHKLAVNLRTICDNRAELLMAVMPRFGLSETELKSIVDSACKEEPKGIGRMLQRIINVLKGDETDTEIQHDAQGATLLPSSLQKKLPMGLKESLIGVPASMHLPVLCALMPLAAAYADGVVIEYCDGNQHKLGLMSIILGEQAGYKSVCKQVVDIWKRPFEEEDSEARRMEDAYKQKKKSRKANEKLPEEPHVMVRMPPITVSCSTLLRRLKNAHEHTLFSFGEELDTLRKTNGAGSWSAKYDIYRLSFDRGEWGQDYNSDQAESGIVKVAYNWSILGTYGAMRRCFKSDNIENGLSSRILVAEMPDNSFAKLQKFGRRSEADEHRILEAVTRLRAAQGLVDTPRLRKVFETWLEQKRVEAAKDIDRVKDTYRKRAAVIGFRCGVIFHLLTGEDRESKACMDFALTMADYCLAEQIKIFGEELMNQFIDAKNECQRYSKNYNIFDHLPQVFSMDDLRAMKHGMCGESAIRQIIYTWSKNGWIEKIERNRWKKLSV